MSGLYVWDKSNNINPIVDVVMTCKLVLSPVNAPYLSRKMASTEFFLTNTGYISYCITQIIISGMLVVCAHPRIRLRMHRQLFASICVRQ